MNCSVVSVFTNLHCADRVCLLYPLSRFFSKGNVRYPVWTCRVPISLILGTRFSLNPTQIGFLKSLNKTQDLCLLQNLKIKQIHQEIHLFYNLFEVRGAWAKGKLLEGGCDGEKVRTTGLHPLESGSGGVTISPTLLGRVLVWKQQNYLKLHDCCWSWGNSGPPRAAAPVTLRKQKRAPKWVNQWVCRPTLKLSIYEIVFSLLAKKRNAIFK